MERRMTPIDPWRVAAAGWQSRDAFFFGRPSPGGIEGGGGGSYADPYREMLRVAGGGVPNVDDQRQPVVDTTLSANLYYFGWNWSFDSGIITRTTNPNPFILGVDGGLNIFFSNRDRTQGGYGELEVGLPTKLWPTIGILIAPDRRGLMGVTIHWGPTLYLPPAFSWIPRRTAR